MGGTRSALPDAGTGGDVGVSGEGFSAPSASPSGGLLQGLSSGGLKISNPVGPGAAINPDDVFRVESALSGADMLDRPPGRSFGDDTFGAIKAAQGRLNTDSRLDLGKSPLKIDGLINPDGPTQAATRRLAGDVLARSPSAIPKPQPQIPTRPGASPLPPSASPAAVVPTPGGLRRETLEQTARRMAKNKPAAPPTAPAAPAKPALSGDDFSELQRLAGGLKKSTHPGPVAKDIADAFRGNAENTAAEFQVVRNALEKTGTPEQVKNLEDGVRAERISPHRFRSAAGGRDGPGRRREY